LVSWIEGSYAFHHSSNHSKAIPPKEFPSPAAKAILFSISSQALR